MLDTSLEAYFNRVLPHLSEKQAAVLNVFKHGEAFTNAEVAAILGWSINRVTPRVLELRQKGLLVCAERRRCTVTGNMAYAWRRTG